MSKYEEIKIRIKKEYLERLRKLDISAQEVFSKGLEETLRSSLKKYMTSSEFLEEIIEDDEEIDIILYPENKFGKFTVSDDDVDNT